MISVKPFKLDRLPTTNPANPDSDNGRCDKVGSKLPTLQVASSGERHEQAKHKS